MKDEITKEEAIEILKFQMSYFCDLKGCEELQAYHMAIRALKQEPCEDAVSREAILQEMDKRHANKDMITKGFIKNLPPVTPTQRLCKDCRFFEYDHVENVDGILLIVAHEICNKWGDGCKTKEDGYCFLFEPKMEGESK